MKPGDWKAAFCGKRHLGFWSMLPDGRILYWSNTTTKYDGMTYEERFGRSGD